MRRFAATIRDSGGFDFDYQAVLNRATALGYTLPNAAQQVKENALMVAIKAAFGVTSSKSISNIASVPILQMLMFATNGDSDYTTISWRNPSNSARQATKVNSPSFTALSGFNRSTTGYLNSRVSTGEYNQQDVTYVTRAFVNAGEDASVTMGAANDNNLGATNGGIFHQPRNIANNTTSRTSSTGVLSQANSDSRNRIWTARSGGTIYQAINNATWGTSSQTFTSVSTKDIFLLRVNGAGTSEFGSTRGISLYIQFTKLLTQTEKDNIDTALANYLS
jgi:hypothetical protein